MTEETWISWGARNEIGTKKKNLHCLPLLPKTISFPQSTERIRESSKGVGSGGIRRNPHWGPSPSHSNWKTAGKAKEWGFRKDIFWKTVRTFPFAICTTFRQLWNICINWPWSEASIDRIDYTLIFNDRPKHISSNRQNSKITTAAFPTKTNRTICVGHRCMR